MAKGWSFGGLVAALKSAAFLDAGTSFGQVSTVGAKGNLIPAISIQTINMTSYKWSSGESRFVYTSSQGMPADVKSVFGDLVQISVVGINDNETYVLFASTAPHLTDIGKGCSGLLYGKRNTSNLYEWTYEPFVKRTISLTKSISPNIMSTLSWNGFYSYPVTETGLTAIGYPIDEAGILLVQSLGGGSLCIQEYTTFNSKRKFSRSFDGSWSPWIEYTRAYQDANFASLFLSGNLNCASVSGTGNATFGNNAAGGSVTLRPKESNQVSLTNEMINYGGQILVGAVQNSFYSTFLTYGARRSGTASIEAFSIYYNGTLKFDFNVDTGNIYTPAGTVATQPWAVANFMTDIRLVSYQEAQAWGGYGFRDESGWVITATYNQTADQFIDFVGRRKLQKLVGGVWYDSYSA